MQSTLGVVGLGLIGGSFAQAMKKKGHRLIGVDNNQASCGKAVATETVDFASHDINVLKSCEAILVATPVIESSKILKSIEHNDAINPQAIFDAGSSKDSLFNYVSELPKLSKTFVACHPITGDEKSGILAAKSNLFNNKKVLICVADHILPQAIEITTRLWQECGLSVETIDAKIHDQLLAIVSHLPHLLAFTMVGQLASHPEHEKLLNYAASGFRDFTRIASSDPIMWRDICLDNRRNILPAIENFIATLEQLSKNISENDDEKLHDFFARMRELRNQWLKTQKR